MKTEQLPIILASSSPRRAALMRSICADFQVIDSHADETLEAPMPPAQMVCYLATLKCTQVAADHPHALVIGADTVVVADAQILGKPHDREDAARMLWMLSGRVHTVYTGVCVHTPWGERVFHQCTDVRFYPLDEAAVQWYLNTGESMDKAGAYGIQEKGALLVESIQGDYFNAMGLPIARLARNIYELFSKKRELI